MKLVYIAGPFRGSTPWDVEQNVRAAEEVALLVAEMGAMPVCPHTMTRHFDGQLTDEFWLEGTLELMFRCDAVLLKNGWQRSSGSCAERAEALAAGMSVLYGIGHLKDWLAQFSR